MRLFTVVAALVGLISADAHAAVLADTGLTSDIALRAAYDEYFTCDDINPCRQDYELVTNQASRFHISASGFAKSVTLALAPAYGAYFAIYHDNGGQLLADTAHLIWTARDQQMSSFIPLAGPGYDSHPFSGLVTFDLAGRRFDAGDYWIALYAWGPTFGYEPLLYAGASGGLNAQEQYFTNGPDYGFVNRAGLQASVRIDGTFDAVPGVPEPASWALMLGGFYISGAALRWRRRQIAG